MKLDKNIKYFKKMPKSNKTPNEKNQEIKQIIQRKVSPTNYIKLKREYEILKEM